MDSLAELAARSRRGDRAAFDALVECCWNEIYAYTAARSSSLGEAEELTQEAFVTAWFALEHYVEQDVFPGWVKGIAANLLRRRRRSRFQADPESIAASIAEQLAADDGGGDDAPERLVRLRRCFELLPPHLQTLATKRFRDDLPLSMICRHLRRTRASIANAVTRLRATLRDCVERQEAAR